MMKNLFETFKTGVCVQFIIMFLISSIIIGILKASPTLKSGIVTTSPAPKYSNLKVSQAPKYGILKRQQLFSQALQGKSR